VADRVEHFRDMAAAPVFTTSTPSSPTETVTFVPSAISM
jgi:hypothetical protein